ncbi:hypothetical protein RB213_010658 [Colletotrichum asianum]
MQAIGEDESLAISCWGIIFSKPNVFFKLRCAACKTKRAQRLPFHAFHNAIAKSRVPKTSRKPISLH